MNTRPPEHANTRPPDYPRPRRRVLIITYYFPPSGGPGVQRVLKFVRYLRDFGWEPVVLTVEEGAFPKRDPSLEKDIPEGVKVVRTPAWDPFAWYGRLTGKSTAEAVKVGSLGQAAPNWKEALARWIRANVFLPDARVGWVPFSIKEGRQILAAEQIDAVFTSGPPHSVHLAGLTLRKLTGTPWLADFRDPWTDINYYHELPHTSLAKSMDSLMERLVLRNADRVITVSPSWQCLLASKVNGIASRIAVVHNGFDEADFKGAQGKMPSAEFVLSYIGSLYASRNPVALWRALAQLKDTGTIPDFRLRLIGTIDAVVQESLETYGIADLVDSQGYVEHEEAVRLMQESHLLLLIIEAFPEDAGMITGKLYEYLAAGRPVLGIGPAGGDAAALLRETKGGALFGRQDTAGIATFIRQQYEAWIEGEVPAKPIADLVHHFSRRAQTQVLARIMDDMISDKLSMQLNLKPLLQ